MDITSLATALYFGQIGGEMPGMGNVVLKPKIVIGAKERLKVGKVINDLDIRLLYGKAKTGTGRL
jgi:hypothetical protein